MEDNTSGPVKFTKMAFGETLYQDLQSQRKDSAKKAMFGKNVDALKIQQAIGDFFKKDLDLDQDYSSPIKKIIVAEGRSIADEIVGTCADENCDLIIMGCKHQGFLEKTLGIDIVKNVLKRSIIPIFIVPFEKK